MNPKLLLFQLSNLLFGPLKKRAAARFKGVRRICFINIGGLGDYMVFLPVIRVFRERYPDAHFTLIAGKNYQTVASLFPEIDETVLFSWKERSVWDVIRILRNGRFDVLIDNHDFEIPFWALTLAIGVSGIPIKIGCARNPLRETVLTAAVPDQRSNTQRYLGEWFFRQAQTFFNHIQWPVSPGFLDKLHYAPPTESRLAIREMLVSRGADPGATPRMLIHPGTSKASKEQGWPKSWAPDRWRSLMAQFLLQHPGGVVYLTAGPEDEEEMADIQRQLETLPLEYRRRIFNLHGELASVTDLAALMTLSDVYVGCDSFAMHLAVSVGIPLVAIFALTSEKKFLPDLPHCRVAVRPGLLCRPCLNITREQSCERPICQEVPVEVMLQQVNRHLQAFPPVVAVPAGVA